MSTKREAYYILFSSFVIFVVRYVLLHIINTTFFVYIENINKKCNSIKKNSRLRVTVHSHTGKASIRPKIPWMKVLDNKIKLTTAPFLQVIVDNRVFFPFHFFISQKKAQKKSLPSIIRHNLNYDAKRTVKLIRFVCISLGVMIAIAVAILISIDVTGNHYYYCWSKFENPLNI